MNIGGGETEFSPPPSLLMRSGSLQLCFEVEVVQNVSGNRAKEGQ